MKPTDDETPAVALRDDVGFVPMAKWRDNLIELLNIAGIGPILGARPGRAVLAHRLRNHSQRLRLDMRKKGNVLKLAIPTFFIVFGALVYAKADAGGSSVLWRYFS